MMHIKYLNGSKLILYIFCGFLFSWLGREDVTLFLFPGKSFDGRSVPIQIALICTYTLGFALFCLFLLSLLEKLSVYWNRVDWKHVDGRLPAKYRNIIVLLVIVLLLFYPLKYIANFISFPYPIECREAAIVYPALALAKGINPYSLQNFPEYIYLYGILYPLTLAPMINLADQPLLIARVYSFFFLVAFLVMSFWTFRKLNASVISALIGVLILLNSMCFVWVLNGARPDAPALFFAYLGFYFLLTREFDWVSIFFCALSCIVSFYFKQYMFLSALVVVIFLFLFVSKRKAYWFILVLAIVGLVSFVVIRKKFPLYYEYSILHHIVVADTSFRASHMEEQTNSFLSYYWIIGLLYLFYLYIIVSAFELKRLKEFRLMPFNLKEPFIRYASVNIFNVGIISMAAILTFWLGKHDGNIYTYYGELLLPFLLYLVVPKLDELFKVGLHRATIQLLILALCVFPFRLNFLQDYASWNEGFSILSQYAANCRNIYDATPLAALYKIEHNISPVYNNGHIDYAQTAIPDRETFFGRISTVPAGYLEHELLEWNNVIQYNIDERAFDCIFFVGEPEFENYVEKVKIHNVLRRTVYLLVPRGP